MPTPRTQSTEDTSPAPTLPGLAVTFRGQPPTEDIVYFAQRCAAKLRGHRGLVVVVVEARPGTQRITIRGPGIGYIVAEDPDAFLAIRNAFDRCSPEAPNTESDLPQH